MSIHTDICQILLSIALRYVGSALNKWLVRIYGKEQFDFLVDAEHWSSLFESEGIVV